MADTGIGGSPVPDLDLTNSLFGPYWISEQIGCVVLIDNSQDIRILRTIDGGSTWNSVIVTSSLDVEVVSCWFDQETPGNTGNLLHLVYLDSSGVAGSNVAYYRNYNINTSTLGTQRIIDNNLTVSTTPSQNRISLTKTLSGNLLMALSTQIEVECYRSIDSGVTWTDRADVFESGTEEDWLLLYPANTGDNNDVCGIFWDRSANIISIKMYDDSVNSWTETSISSSMTDSSISINMDASVRHSDNHILLAAHSNDDDSTDNLGTWDLNPNSISSPGITSKTNVFTNQAESAQVAVIINQQNDNIYVAHLKGGTWQSAVDVVFHKSTDGMTSWGSEQAYNETTDDYRLVHGGRTIGNSGGRIQWSWFHDDFISIYINLVNDIEITAISIGTNMQINIGDTWKSVDALKINIGDVWKDVVSVKQNIGDVWKDVF